MPNTKALLVEPKYDTQGGPGQGPRKGILYGSRKAGAQNAVHLLPIIEGGVGTGIGITNSHTSAPVGGILKSSGFLVTRF
jgi:hypothetical protein